MSKAEGEASMIGLDTLLRAAADISRGCRKMLQSIVHHGDFPKKSVITSDEDQEVAMAHVGSYDGLLFFWDADKRQFYFCERKSLKKKGAISNRYTWVVSLLTPHHSYWPKLLTAVSRSSKNSAKKEKRSD